MTYPIIKTDNYILITSDEEIKEDCYAVHFSPLGEIELVTANGVCKLDKKIIAHLPLNNSSILEGVPLLPPLPNEEDVENLATEWYQDYYSFIEGYKKAKEKYKFTEEDMRDAVEIACWNMIGKTVTESLIKNLVEKTIQSISQPKLPVGFKCEMELNPVNHAAGLKLTGNLIMDIAITQNYTPKIINGVMQGEWIFE